MWKLVSIALVIFFIILAVFIYYRYKARYTNYLSGMWVGETSYLQNAGLRTFNLFIKDPKTGYLIMVTDKGDIIANYPVTICHSYGNVVTPSLAIKDDKCGGSVKFTKDDDKDSEDKFPLEDVTSMSISMLNGTLTLHDKTKMFAFLQKDNSASALALAI
jgi:hypothetical protein